MTGGGVCHIIVLAQRERAPLREGMIVASMPGFEFRYRLNGEEPTTRRLRFKNTETLSDGDMLNLESGEVHLGAKGDGHLVGAAQQTKAGTGGTTYIDVITDGDAVYGVEDANARVKGVTLDLAGITGAQGVAEGPDGGLEVVVDCSAAEKTLVRISVGSHGEAPPAGGRLNSAIANAVVRTASRYIGRGPTRAQAFFRHNFVVVVMEDTLTTGERSLIADGREEAVLDMRREFQRAMRDDLTAPIEELTGCKVLALMSDNHIDPDLAAEIFVLDQPVSGERSAGG
jgi:uncharacterized protein YbcI